MSDTPLWFFPTEFAANCSESDDWESAAFDVLRRNMLALTRYGESLTQKKMSVGQSSDAIQITKIIRQFLYVADARINDFLPRDLLNGASRHAAPFSHVVPLAFVGL